MGYTPKIMREQGSIILLHQMYQKLLGFYAIYDIDSYSNAKHLRRLLEIYEALLEFSYCDICSVLPCR